MLNGVGSSTSSPIGAQRGGDAKRIDAAQSRSGAPAGSAIATTVGRVAAEGPPVATDRVDALRAAIRAGTYKPDPDAIAGKMIAADLG